VSLETKKFIVELAPESPPRPASFDRPESATAASDPVPAPADPPVPPDPALPPDPPAETVDPAEPLPPVAPAAPPAAIVLLLVLPELAVVVLDVDAPVLVVLAPAEPAAPFVVVCGVAPESSLLQWKANKESGTTTARKGMSFMGFSFERAWTTLRGRVDSTDAIVYFS